MIAPMRTRVGNTSDRTVPQRAALVVSDGPVGPQSNKAPAGESLRKKIGLPGTNQRMERLASSPFAAAAELTALSPTRTISCPVPPKQPRADTARFKLESSKRPSICTAFSKSSADALALVASSLGWAVHPSEREDSHVYWVVSAEHMKQRLAKLKPGQIVARVPGMHDMARKCSFSRLMTRSQKLYPTLFDFYPQTWNLPDDLARMQHDLKAPSMDWSRDAVIVKPDDGSKGKGIFISTSYEDLTARLSGMPLFFL